MECFECGRTIPPAAHGFPPVLLKLQDGADQAISGSIERGFCGVECASEHLQTVTEDNAVERRNGSGR